MSYNVCGGLCGVLTSPKAPRSPQVTNMMALKVLIRTLRGENNNDNIYAIYPGLHSGLILSRNPVGASTNPFPSA